MKNVRGIRGAVVASQNQKEAILNATKELITEILLANPGINFEDVASVFFTVTPDLNQAFPAVALRELGWVQVPILCAQEIPVPGSLNSCIRILIHWNTERRQEEIQHVYLGAAKILRPDIAR